MVSPDQLAHQLVCPLLSLCSVAIMSDAAHMLSDVSAFLVSIFAAWAATQPSSWHYSFGYHRAEILGALVSVLTIWAVTGALVFEAVQRTINPVRVDGKSKQDQQPTAYCVLNSSCTSLVCAAACL
jgi:cation diffusion facilitator family transporter